MSSQVNNRVKDILRRKYMLPVMIVAGLLLAYLLVSGGGKVEHKGLTLPERAVEVIDAKRIPFRSQATGYGNVEPAISLLTKAEVSGKVSFIHPELKQGQSIAAGTVVIRIEASDYEVSLKQTQADLRTNQESLRQLEEEEKTVVRSLSLAKENLAVGEKEFARIKDVYDQKLVSRSTLDAEKQKVISQRQQVEELQGQLNGFASRKDSVKASIARAEQQVKGQQTNLGRTEIVLPFDARIGEVLVEKGEFVSTGATLFEALDMNGVEIKAELSVKDMHSLASHLENAPLRELQISDFKNAMRQLNLSAKVALVGGMPEAQWPAKVLRIGEAIDPTRRTIGVVVGVDKPYDKVIPGRRPPLLKGMYTAVHLSSPERSALVVPRKAVHEGRLYIVTEANTLAIREVELQVTQNDLAVIRSGISEGDKVIVSDVYPVIEGMPVKVKYSEDVEKAVAAAAKGAN